MEKFPQPHNPESSAPQLRYPEGWREILEAPDAVDYQTWMNDLTDFTQQRLQNAGVPWAEDRAAVTVRWQRAIELIVDIAIDPEDLSGMSQAEVVETALNTLQTNIESMGWDDPGLAFTVPNMFSCEEASIDLRHLPDALPDNF